MKDYLVVLSDWGSSDCSSHRFNYDWLMSAAPLDEGYIGEQVLISVQIWLLYDKPVSEWKHYQDTQFENDVVITRLN